MLGLKIATLQFVGRIVTGFPLPVSMTTDRPPDFVVIGAMRAGTTTLYEILRASGAVQTPRMKETDFFLTRQKTERGLDWFNRQFAALDARPIGDVSPNYTKRDFFPGVADRIHAANPFAKIVFVARDPVARAISQYKHMAAMGHDMPPPGDLESDRLGRHIVNTSRYAWQLDPFLQHWGMDDIHIVDFAELASDQDAASRRLFEALGVSPVWTPQDEVRLNTARDVGRLPAWWGALRGSRAGEWLRARTPRGLIAPVKSVLARKPDPSVASPGFDAAARGKLKAALADDAAAFRKLTGLAFKDWPV